MWAQSLRVRSHSDLVLIPATVTDGSDRPVTNLNRNNFRVFEDRREQRLLSFASEDGPISLTILWDASRSMQRAIADVRAAVSGLIESLPERDDVALIAFGERVVESTPFVSDERFLRSVASRVSIVNGTALWDAVALGLQNARKGRNKRRAMLLFTDGADRDSRYSWKEVRRIVREADVRIYSIGPEPWHANDDRDAAQVEELTRDSGGRSFWLRQSRQFADRVRDLDLHSEYVLGFEPAASSRDGKWHEVGLRIEGVNEKLHACWRHGYYAPVE